MHPKDLFKCTFWHALVLFGNSCMTYTLDMIFPNNTVVNPFWFFSRISETIVWEYHKKHCILMLTFLLFIIIVIITGNCIFVDFIREWDYTDNLHFWWIGCLFCLCCCDDQNNIPAKHKKEKSYTVQHPSTWWNSHVIYGTLVPSIFANNKNYG